MSFTIILHFAFYIFNCLFYTLLCFGGLHPLCGIGVISLMKVTDNPDDCNALIAVSRPEPGPETKTATCFKPISDAFLAQFADAIWAAKGVPFFVPLKPDEPLDAQFMTLPLSSVIVMIVLLKDDLI